MKKVFRVLAAALAVVMATPLSAQTFPSKTLRLVVPFPAGGSTDAITRVVGKRLSEELGQAVIVDNRSGAGGTIGVKEVLRAPADGHTLLFTPMGAVSIAPLIYKDVGYKAADLEPVAVLFRAPFFLMVPVSSKFNSAQDLLRAGKSSNAPMFGSSGNGALSHIMGEAINQTARTSFTHVPYKGGAPLLLSLAADETQWALLQAADAKSQVDGGKLKPLLVLSSQRSKPWTNVPTSDELGLKGLNLRVWNGVFAPPGTPAEVVQLLNRKIVAILGEPDVQARLRAMVVDEGDGVNSPTAFRAQIAEEVTVFSKIISSTQIKVD